MDYISLESQSENFDWLINNPHLNFLSLVNIDTGEANLYRDNLRRSAFYRDLKFSINTNSNTKLSKIKIKGSIHKFYHNGVNYTDFPLNDFIGAVNALISKIGINPHEFKVNSFEFGVNIRLPISCSELLNNLIAYEGETPVRDNFEGSGLMYVFKKSQYLLKIYDKGLQYSKNKYRLPDTGNLLRIELRVTKMDYIKKKGIVVNTLSDLMQSDIWQGLSKLLISIVENLVIFDSESCLNNLSIKDRFFITEANNPKYWQELKEQKRDKLYRRKLDQYRKLVRQCAKRDILKLILDTAKNKLDTLCNDVRLLPFFEVFKMSDYYPYISCHNPTLRIVKCKVTGLDISHQSEQSEYLSEKTLELYEVKAPEIFYRLLIQFGGGKYDDNCIERIAKSIRCYYSYKRRNLKKRINKVSNSSPLFSVKEILTLSENQRDLLSM